MKNITQSIKIIALSLVLSFGLSYVYAWTAPTVSAPNGNVSAPINTSGTTQTKSGQLVTDTLGVNSTLHGYSNAYFDGRVGVGTTSPMLDLGNGSLQRGLDVSGWILARGNGGGTWGDNAARIGVVQPGVDPNNSTTGAWFIAANPQTSPLYPSTGQNYTFAIHQAGLGDRLTIDRSGNVGIGTPTPQVELHVKPSDGSNGDIAVESADGLKWTMSTVNGSGDWVLNRDIPGTLPTIVAHRNGNVDVNGDVCSNTSGKCLSKQGAVYYVSQSTLNTYQSGCDVTAPTTAIYCMAGCNRYCMAQGYVGGYISEWDGVGKNGACTCTR